MSPATTRAARRLVGSQSVDVGAPDVAHPGTISILELWNEGPKMRIALAILATPMTSTCPAHDYGQLESSLQRKFQP
jgi:hypothetical protein